MTYAPVNGMELYYETRGSGRPLVLLHGGVLTIELNLGSFSNALPGVGRRSPWSFRATGTPPTPTAR
jgi:pimeloyl-ACP methyl ester carboxylesterase